MKIKIIVSRKSVMGIVEGISVTISQHNNGTPTYEQLWASDSESPKLDIYYREAIGDLERNINRYITGSSDKFDLQKECDDYILHLNVNQNWPKKLKGLLDNKLQDYLVHSITAGWLNDFADLTIKQDYQTMATQDLDDIQYIIALKSFDFNGQQRTADVDKSENEVATEAGARMADTDKEDNSEVASAQQRTADVDKSENEVATEAGARMADTNKSQNDIASTAGGRRSDTDKQANSQTSSKRTADVDKSENEVATEAGNRHDASDTDKSENSSMDASARHEDDSEVHITHDWTDWSGTHIPFFLGRPRK